MQELNVYSAFCNGLVLCRDILSLTTTLTDYRTTQSLVIVRLHSLCIARGGQMILRGDLNFFEMKQGGILRFFITGRGGGGCQFFYLILVYNEKATVIVFFLI